MTDAELVREGKRLFYASHPELLQQRRQANFALIFSAIVLAISLAAFYGSVAW